MEMSIDVRAGWSKVNVAELFPNIIGLVEAKIRHNLWKQIVLPNRIVFKIPIPGRKVLILFF